MNDAAGYSRVNGNTRRDAREVLAEYKDLLSWTPGELVLDVGSGAGDTTAEVLLPALPADVTKVVGIDISHAMVEHAVATQRHPKLSFTQMDIGAKQLNKDKLAEMTDSLPLVEGIFDKVFSFFCLHWLQDQKLAFKNLYDLMKPGAEGLVIFISNCPIYELYEVLAEHPKWKTYMKDASSHDSPYHKSDDPSAEVSAVLSHVGFEVKNCVNEERSFPYDTVSHLKGLLQTVNPFFEGVPRHLRDDYMNDSISEIGKMKTMEFFDPNDVHKEGHVVSMKYGLIVAHFKKPPSTNSTTGKQNGFTCDAYLVSDRPVVTI